MLRDGMGWVMKLTGWGWVGGSLNPEGVGWVMQRWCGVSHTGVE